LKKIRSVIAPQGTLYIEVPDSENIEPSVAVFYHHEHLLYFTRTVLRSYLRSNGFEPQYCERFDQNPLGSGFAYPVLRSVSVAGEPTSLEQLPRLAEKVYVENIKRNDEYLESTLTPIRKRLKELSNGDRRIGLFGAGPHTMDLLGLLKDDDICWSKMFDNNPNKHGKSMLDIPIVKPDKHTLRSVDCVLFSSAEFEQEMVKQVRSLVGSQIELITIYDNYTTH
jgi:hypothetical protein